MRMIRLGLAITSLIFALGQGQARAAETITIGNADSAVADVLSNIVKEIVEANYGVKVELVSANNAVAWQAMDEGKGAIDARVDVWMPNNQGRVDKYVSKAGTIALAGPISTAKTGFCTTKYVQDKFGVKSIYDLARPEVAASTDTKHTGKGEIWLGAPDWNSVPVDQVRARDYGFADLYDLQTYSEDLATAKVMKAIKNNEGVVWSCDTTQFPFATGQVVLLDEPPYDPAKWKFVDPSHAGWFEASKITCGWPSITSYIAYSKRLTTATPEVVHMFEKMKINSNMASQWTNAVYYNKQDPAEVAHEWIAANKTAVNGWLGM
jgi:glycine betaine/proline transport system substrate-binding protein